MAPFLSEQWVQELAERVAPFAAAAGTVAVGWEIDGAARFTLVLRDGAVEVRPGTVEAADVVFVADRATAAALSEGTLVAQDALAAGRLRVRGDVRAARAAGAAFAERRAPSEQEGAR